MKRALERLRLNRAQKLLAAELNKFDRQIEGRRQQHKPTRDVVKAKRAFVLDNLKTAIKPKESEKQS